MAEEEAEAEAIASEGQVFNACVVTVTCDHAAGAARALWTAAGGGDEGQELQR